MIIRIRSTYYSFYFWLFYTHESWDSHLGFSSLPYGKNHTIPHLSQITFVQNLTFSMLDTDILYSVSYCYKWLSSLFYLWDAHLMRKPTCVCFSTHYDYTRSFNEKYFLQATNSIGFQTFHIKTGRKINLLAYFEFLFLCLCWYQLCRDAKPSFVNQFWSINKAL